MNDKVARIRLPYERGKLVFGKDSVPLKPGLSYAPYSKICLFCDGRHGKPGNELEIESCKKCLKAGKQTHRTSRGELLYYEPKKRSRSKKKSSD